MKIRIISDDITFHTTVDSLCHNFEEKGIEIVITNEHTSETNQNEIAMIPFELELRPYISIVSMFDSISIDEIRTIDKKGQTFKKAFNKIDVIPIIKKRFISIQKRHVPTNRGK